MLKYLERGSRWTLISAIDVQNLIPAALGQWKRTGVKNDLLQLVRYVDIQIDDFSDNRLAWTMPGMVLADPVDRPELSLNVVRFPLYLAFSIGGNWNNCV